MIVGQLTVSLTSETNAFQAGMRRAQREVSTFEATVKSATRQGIDPMMARLGEAARGAAAWDAGMRRMRESTEATAAALGTVPAVAAKATLDLGRLREPLTALAVSAARVPGPLGQLAGLLTSMTYGGAVAAGLAAVAGGLALIWKWARDSRKPLEDLTAELDKAIELRRRLNDPSGVAIDQLRVIQQERARRQDELRALDLVGAGAGRRGAVADEIAKLQAREREIAAQLAEGLKRLQPEQNEITRAAATGLGASLRNRLLDELADFSPEEAARRTGRLLARLSEGIEARNLGLGNQSLPDLSGDVATLGFRPPEWAVQAKQQAELYRQLWKNALLGVQQEFADFFGTLFQQGTTFLGLLRNMLQTAQRVAAQLLSQQIMGFLGELVPAGAGGGLTHSNGATAALQGESFHITLVQNYQAVDAAGMDAVLMRHKDAVTAAVATAVNQSRAAARAVRGWG